MSSNPPTAHQLTPNDSTMLATILFLKMTFLVVLLINVEKINLYSKNL